MTRTPGRPRRKRDETDEAFEARIEAWEAEERAAEAAPDGDPTAPPVDAEEAAAAGVDMTLPVHLAWINVMRDVGVISKGQRNKQQGFNFRGIDAVVNVVGPVLRRHGVSVRPLRVVELREERYSTSGGTAMHGVSVTMLYRITGPTGEHMDVETIGEASDAGDKAVTKAQSVAQRVMFLQSLTIPTDEVDPDAMVHNRAADEPQGNRPGYSPQAAQSTGQYGLDPNDPDYEAKLTEAHERRRRDPRVQDWDRIKAKAEEIGLAGNEIRADFAARMGGKTLDGPLGTEGVATLEELSQYLQIMGTPPDDVPHGDEPTGEGDPA